MKKGEYILLGTRIGKEKSIIPTESLTAQDFIKMAIIPIYTQVGKS